MEMKCGFFEVTGSESLTCTLSRVQEEGGIRKYTFDLKWDLQKIDTESEFVFSWDKPMVELNYVWSYHNGFNRTIGVNWLGRWDGSNIAGGAPVFAYYDADGVNQYTWALSECAKATYCKGGVSEEKGAIEFVFRVPVFQYTDCDHTQITFYLDQEKKPFYKAIQQISKWWETECGLVPAYVPEDARDAVYSFWYSYHQHITDVEVEEECRRAKELGFSICIVDDGWQTDDTNRGYAFCGDWKPEKTKFPDMAAHVQRVHDIGMKYILWFSMPFVGFQSENYERFSNMLLYRDEGMGAGILDPRFPEVREFLIGIYKRAIAEWKLDGLKLDFIDCWANGKSPSRPGMDIPSLSDAVDALMKDVVKELTAVNPDVLLEFRQSYTGPNMRQYGNMFRVADCPYNYATNRIGVLNLRLLQGNSAVHSDMLMWHPEETPENAAKQIIGVLFGTLQFSAKLEGMTDEMKKMSRFWLTFMQQHRHLLLESELAVFQPQNHYSWAKATADNECAVAVYGNDTCVTPDTADVIYLANGTGKDRLIVELDGTYQMKVQNCLGDCVEEKTVDFNGITAVAVPESGLVTLTK